MEPEGSLPQAQMPATYPYPEPAWSSPYRTSHFLKIYLNIILSFTSGFPKWSLSLRSPPPPPKKTLYTPLLSPVRNSFPAHLIHLYFVTRTILCEVYKGPAVSFLTINRYSYRQTRLYLLYKNIL